ncbi:hypothetical protein ACFZ8E_21000 [Methylobacterium sp. HMF5984]|nr:hypothetical protein [Methylobacterium sp. E-016]
MVIPQDHNFDKTKRSPEVFAPDLPPVVGNPAREICDAIMTGS